MGHLQNRVFKRTIRCWLRRSRRVADPASMEKHHATDGAAREKPNLFELFRVATEEGYANTVGDGRSLVPRKRWASASKTNFNRPPSLFRVKMLIFTFASCCIKHTVLQVTLNNPHFDNL